MHRNISDVIDHLLKYEDFYPETQALVRHLLMRAMYHAPEGQGQDWLELAAIIHGAYGQPDPRDKSDRIAKIMRGELLMPVKDVPVGRIFKVWQTNTTYRMLAKDNSDGTILAQDAGGNFFENANVSQLVELLPDDKPQEEKPSERY